jgi:hypothetical protein
MSDVASVQTPDKTKEGQTAYLTRYLQQCWQEADDATKKRQAVWSELWEIYQCRQDYSKKASWQSKIVAPKVWMAVEKSSAEVRRALMQTQKLFKLDLDDSDERGKMSQIRAAMMMRPTPQDQMMLMRLDQAQQASTQPEEQELYAQQAQQLQGEIANYLGRCSKALQEMERNIKLQEIQMGLDESRFISALKRTNLAQVYSEMCKSAFLLGLGVHKIGWTWKLKQAVCKHIDVFNIALSPDWEPSQQGRPEYIIERSVMKLARLHEMAEEVNKNSGQTIYDLEVIKQVQSDYTSPDQDKQDKRRGISSYLRKTKQVELKHFWGDVPREDSTGYDVRKRYVVMVNDKDIIRNGQNPFDHGLDPYILTIPLVFPHRGHSGVGLVEYMVKLNYAYNNLLNIYLDNLNFTVNRQYQVDVNLLADPRTMTAVYPGKIWELKPGAGQTQPAIRGLEMGQVGGEAIKALEVIDHDIGESSGVTEYMQGVPGERDKTLGEIQLGLAQSKGLFDVVGKEMEQYSLKPTLERMYDLYVQFAGYTPRKDKYHITVGGLSVLLDIKQLTESLSNVLSMCFKFPPLAERTDIDDLWQKLLSVHNLSDAYQEPQEAKDNLSQGQKEAILSKADQDGKALAQKMLAQQQGGGAPTQPQPQQQPQPSGITT